jgi:hypothetical protein
MIFFLILQVRETKNWTPWAEKNKEKVSFFKKNPFLVLWINLTIILDTLDIETTWQWPKKIQILKMN